MQIIDMPIGGLKQYEKNAKKHDAKQIDAVAESIKQFGFVQPVVVDRDGVIVIGHCRVLAAKKIGMESVPCVRVDELTDEQVKALRLADNKTNESPWDVDLLAESLDEIFNIDMTVFGFSETHDTIVEDSYSGTVPEEPICELGDVWQLGRHRLLCGSSTDTSDVARLMDGQNSKLLFTSPPYSDMREYNGGKDLSVENIAQFLPCYEPFAALQTVNLGIQRKDGEIYPYWNVYIDVAKQAGLKLLAWNVWDKLSCGSIGQQKAMIPIRHEWIFCFGKEPVPVNQTWRKKESSIYSGERTNKVRQADGTMKTSRRGNCSSAFKKMESLVEIPDQTSIESITKQTSERGKIRSEQPATFPVALPSEYIVAFTDAGDIVVEPFGGAGTTLIACEQLDRVCYIMELDPRYCDVIIKRWEQLTGEHAAKLTS